jgi:hypothetical protein
MANGEIFDDFTITHFHQGLYSYGDSAGITPGFPFNPDYFGNQLRCKCKENEPDLPNYSWMNFKLSHGVANLINNKCLFTTLFIKVGNPFASQRQQFKSHPYHCTFVEK